jgi:hypothetical protein
MIYATWKKYQRKKWLVVWRKKNTATEKLFLTLVHKFVRERERGAWHLLTPFPLTPPPFSPRLHLVKKFPVVISWYDTIFNHLCSCLLFTQKMKGKIYSCHILLGLFAALCFIELLLSSSYRIFDAYIHVTLLRFDEPNNNKWNSRVYFFVYAIEFFLPLFIIIHASLVTRVLGRHWRESEKEKNSRDFIIKGSDDCEMYLILYHSICAIILS